MADGFFVSPAQLANFILSLNRVIDTASANTGRHASRVGAGIFHKAMVSSPSVCMKAGGVFSLW